MSAKPAESKQAELAASLAASNLEKLRPVLDEKFQQVVDLLTEVLTTLAQSQARLEVLEAAIAGGKKPVKTAAAKPAASKAGAKTAAKKAPAGDPRDKVKNSMLFFRYMFAQDDQFRTEYLTEEIEAAIDGDEGLAKKKDAHEKLLATGSLLWKDHLTPDQKDDVRKLYNEWAEARKKEELGEQLDEAADAGADGDADAEAE